MNRRLVELVSTAILVGVTWWTTLPEHRRRRHRMMISRTLARSTEHLARRFGHIAMREELEGRTDDAHRLYRAAYRLMTGPYRSAQRHYDNARDTT